MGGMKKGAGKKPGQILVEALLEWQAKEAQWLRDEVCLEHSLATARGYLDRINQEKDAIADAIEAAVGTRLSRSRHSDAYRATVRTASRGVTADMEDVSKRKVLQRQLITELQRERSALAGAAAARKIELEATANAPLAESIGRLEERLAELHARLSRLRVAEARTAAKAMELSLTASSIDTEALLSAPSTVVVLGRSTLGAAAALVRRSVETHVTASSDMGGGFVHVLGDPQTSLDTLGVSAPGPAALPRSKRLSADTSLLPIAIERAKHRVRVTSCGAGETASRHVARILRSMVANSATVHTADGEGDGTPPSASRLLLVSGRLVPGASGLLQIRSGQGGGTAEQGLTLSLHDLLDLTRGTDIAVAIDAFAPGGRGLHGFSLLAVPGVASAQCWRHRQELPSAHVVANASADGPVAMLLALVAAAGLAVGSGEADGSSDGTARTTVVGLAAQPNTVADAVALLASRATVSRELEALANRRDWPSWVPSGIDARPAKNALPVPGITTTADAAPDGAPPASDDFAVMPMCDRKLLAAVRAPSGATAAFPVRQALRFWSGERRVSCDCLVRANSAFAGDEVAAKVLKMAEAELDGAPLRWIIGHVDSRKLTADNTAAVETSVAGTMLVNITEVPENATREQLARALQAELGVAAPCAVSVAGSFVTHGASARAATLRVVPSRPDAAVPSTLAVEAAVRAILGIHRRASDTATEAPDDVVATHKTSTQFEWRVRLRCTMGVYLGLLMLAKQSAVSCNEAIVVSDIGGIAMPTPWVVPADREADTLSELRKRATPPLCEVRVVLRHCVKSAELDSRVEDALRSLAVNGAISTSTAATATAWIVPATPRRDAGSTTGPRSRTAASALSTGGLNAPRDGAAPDDRPVLEVFIGGVLRHRVHWTVSEADTTVGFTKQSIRRAVEAALHATPLVV